MVVDYYKKITLVLAILRRLFNKSMLIINNLN